MARVTSSFRACRIVTSSPVLTELSRRRDHLDDGSEEVGVDDGDGAGRVLLGLELSQGLPEQRVVVGGEVVDRFQAARPGVVAGRVGVGERDEHRRRAAQRDHAGDHQRRRPVPDQPLLPTSVPSS